MPKTKSLRTYLPYANFKMCAAMLPGWLLSKQHADCLKILEDWEKFGMYPMSLWHKHKGLFICYAVEICSHFQNVYYDDESVKIVKSHGHYRPQQDFRNLPEWLGDDDFHARNRSYLKKTYPDLFPLWRVEAEPRITFP